MPIDWDGDVTPTLDSNYFSTIPSLFDADNDGKFDFLTNSPSEIDLTEVSTIDPTGAVGGEAWDWVKKWAYWDLPFSIGVGNKFWGRLSVNQNLRAMHFTVGDEANSDGHLQLSGPNHYYGNDRDSIPESVRRIISLAHGGSVLPADVTYDMLGDEINHPWAGHVKIPQPAGNYNLWAGKAGKGKVTIGSDAIVEIRHQVLVGGYYDGETFVAGKRGRLRITGVDTYLRCNGSFLADIEDPGTITAAEPCQISTAGTLEMTGGSFYSRTGFVNQGFIDIIGGDASPEMSAGSWLDGEDVTQKGKLTNNGPLRVRKGVTFNVSCPLDNGTAKGDIYLEPGAVLNVTGGFVNQGLIHRSPCSPAGTVIENGESWVPEVRVEDKSNW